MFYTLSLLSGVLIAVMITINGMLTLWHGVHSATVIIHFVGLILITALVLIKRENPFAARHTWWLYLGGAVGIMVTILNNSAFGRISVSAILALVLLGQIICGFFFDQFGFLGMQKHPFAKRKLVGVIIIMLGIFTMIDNFEFAAIVMSFAAGCCIVVARTLNALLANVTSLRIGVFYHHLIGTVLSLPILLLLGSSEVAAFTLAPPTDWYIYLGGIFGITVLLIGNIIVMKVSAFYLTLLIFVGQIFTSVIIDMILTQAFSHRNLLGGIIVAIGLCVNLLLDRKRATT